jgi:hypothetical protein
MHHAPDDLHKLEVIVTFFEQVCQAGTLTLNPGTLTLNPGTLNSDP